VSPDEVLTPTTTELLQFGLGSLALGVPAAIWAASRLRRHPAAPTEGSPARPVDLLLFLPLLLGSQVLVMTVLLGLFPRSRFPEGPPPLASITAVPFFLAPLAARAARGAREAGTWRVLGLGPPDTGTTTNALLAWLGCLPLLYGLSLVSPWLYEQAGVPWAPQAHGEGIAALAGPQLWVACALAAVVVPCFEELVFRGWLQQGLARLAHPRIGIGLTALLFTLNHDQGVWLPIGVLAVLLGVVRERTQSLWPCLAIHVAHNGLQVALLVAGLEP